MVDLKHKLYFQKDLFSSFERYFSITNDLLFVFSFIVCSIFSVQQWIQHNIQPGFSTQISFSLSKIENSFKINSYTYYALNVCLSFLGLFTSKSIGQVFYRQKLNNFKEVKYSSSLHDKILRYGFFYRFENG